MNAIQTALAESAAEELARAMTELMSRENSEAGVTSRELRKKTGWSTKRIQDLLNDLNDQGRIDVVRVTRRDITGSIKPVPGYRLKGDEKELDE